MSSRRDVPASRRSCSSPPLAAIALALSLVLPWYQKSVLAERQDRPGQRVGARRLHVRRGRDPAGRARACCSSSGRARRSKAFHLPGGDGVAITIAGGWARAAARLADVRQARHPGRRRRPSASSGGSSCALLGGGRADRRGRARARGARARAAEPGRRRRRAGSRAAAPRARPPARPPAARRDRGHRDAARPAGVGGRCRASRTTDSRRARTHHALPDRSRSAPRACPTRSEERTTRLPDPSDDDLAAVRRSLARDDAPRTRPRRPAASAARGPSAAVGRRHAALRLRRDDCAASNDASAGSVPTGSCPDRPMTGT